MHRISELLLLLVLAGSSLFSGAAMAQSASNVEEAKAAFLKGNDEFADGNYLLASEQYRRAYALKPTWKLLYNIGQAEAAAKRYGLALDAFEEYIAQGGDEIAVERMESVSGEISRMRNFIGVLNVVAPDGTELFIDDFNRGKTPFKGLLRVAVGEHRILLRQGDTVLLEQNLSIAGGMTTTVEAAAAGKDATTNPPVDQTDSNDMVGPTAEENQTENQTSNEDNADQSDSTADKGPGPGKVLFVSGLATSGVGLVGVGLGVVFTTQAFGHKDDRTSAVEKGDIVAAKEADDAMLSASKRMIVGYVAGGVLAATGAALLTVYFLKKKKSKMAVAPAPNGFGLNF